MDQQEKKLREQLAGSGVRVAREGDNIRLIMPGSITFETDSYTLRSDFYDVLSGDLQFICNDKSYTQGQIENLFSQL